VSINVLVVRPATTDEIEFCRWGEAMLAEERAMKHGQFARLAARSTARSRSRGLASRFDVRFGTA
jgi:hypothetical protein